jgi:hypothetical protein
LVSASIALGNIPARFVNNPSLSFAFDISRIAFYITIIFFFLILLRPQTLGRFIRWVIRKLGQFMPSKDHFLQQLSGKFLQFIANYQEHLLYYWRREKMTLVWNFVLTIILYFNKCLVAYVILLGLGIDVGLWQVVMLQMLIIFFLYFAPTPGASLVAETGMSAIMSLIVPTYSLSLFTVLWRFITTYFGVFLGSIVLLRILSQGVHIKEHSTT